MSSSNVREGIAFGHDHWGNEVLQWMGDNREVQAVAVRDLVRRDVTTQDRIDAMTRRIANLEEIREYIVATRDALLTPAQKQRIVRQESAQSLCASSVVSGTAPFVARALCHVCGQRIAVDGASVPSHVEACREKAREICRVHNLVEPALPVEPTTPEPRPDANGVLPSVEAVELYNREARRAFVACMRPGPNGGKHSIIEVGRLLNATASAAPMQHDR